MKSPSFNIQPELKQLITPKQAWHYRVLPHSGDTGNISFYIDKHCDVNAVSGELEVVLGKRVSLIPANTGTIEDALNRNYRLADRTVNGFNTKKFRGDKNKVVHDLITEAISDLSSDIHFEAREKYALVRFRIDGHLVDKYHIDLPEYPAIVNTVKIQAGLDIAEKRLPQDGRIFYTGSEKKMDVRVPLLGGSQKYC